MNIRMATLPQLLRDHARRSPQRLSQRHKTRGIWREYDFSQVQRNVMDIGVETIFNLDTGHIFNRSRMADDDVA